MKTFIMLLFALSCVALNAQVLIDQPKKQPDLIITSKSDTIEADYLTESGIFRGSIVKRVYTVEYAAHEGHNGLTFQQVVEVLNAKKEPVKKVLAVREIDYVSTGTTIRTWEPSYQIFRNNN